jgi:DNA-binding transcriptional LysR family regulator
MDRADLELVVAIGRTGSLTGAARVLHVAQPALSRRLRALEQAAGGPLFERGRHGARATPAGRVLLEGAATALAAIEAVERDTADAVAGRAGRLRVGTTPTLGADVLPSALFAFRQAYPGVRLDLSSSGDSGRLRREVATGGLDVAVAALGATPEPGTAVAVAGQQRFVLIAPVDLHLRAGRRRGSVPRAVLGEVPVVALVRGEGLRDLLEEITAGTEAAPAIAIETSEREMLAPLVAAGLGVSLLPEVFARDRSIPGVAVYTLDPAVARPVGAVVASGRRSAIVAGFVTALKGAPWQ